MRSKNQFLERNSVASVFEDIDVIPFFQPIICLKTGRVFAYESLIRGCSKIDNTIIPPKELFSLTDSLHITGDFDRLCQHRALEAFKKFNSNSLLFMNVHTNYIFNGTKGQQELPTLTEEMGFNPKVIGLEFIESRANSPQDLISFVSKQRESGFLIVVDDFGSEHSNIERLILLHPDIIKIDRNIVHGIDKDVYRQSILKSIVGLSEMTGAVCLAEGVETPEELMTCALFGVNLLQGFEIARPDSDLKGLEAQALRKIEIYREKIHSKILCRLRETRFLTGDVNMTADWLIRQIDVDSLESMESVFQEFVVINPNVELIFLLDENGIQISNMICAPHIENKPYSYIFHVEEKGSNHSLRPYFTCFSAFKKTNRFLTDKHLSSCSGNLCRTLAIRLQGDGKSYILCIDFLEEEIKTPLHFH